MRMRLSSPACAAKATASIATPFLKTAVARQRHHVVAEDFVVRCVVNGGGFFATEREAHGIAHALAHGPVVHSTPTVSNDSG